MITMAVHIEYALKTPDLIDLINLFDDFNVFKKFKLLSKLIGIVEYSDTCSFIAYLKCKIT